MKMLKIADFGQALASRTEGREAALSALAYQFQGQTPEELKLDFQDVIIMTPSWLGEFIQTLEARGVKRFIYVNTSPVVDASLEFVDTGKLKL